MRSHGYNSFYSTEKDIKKMDAIKDAEKFIENMGFPRRVDASRKQ